MSHPVKFPFIVSDAINTETSVGALRFDVNLRLCLDDEGRLTAERPVRTVEGPSRDELVQLACRIYDARRTRDRLLGPKMFGEPAWDMILAAYCLPTRGEKLTVTSIAHAANVPAATGHRWLATLVEEGLLERVACGRDARRQMVRLTRIGRQNLEHYLSRLFNCETPLPPYPQDAGQ